MKISILCLFLCFGIVSCSSTDTPTPDVVAVVTKPQPHPVEPDWVTFTRKPIIRHYKMEEFENYEVSDQFMERALQLQDYADRIKTWKRKNLIP